MVRHHDEDVVLVEQVVDFAEAGIDIAIEFVEEVLAIVLTRTSSLGEMGMCQDVERLDAQSDRGRFLLRRRPGPNR